MRAPPRPQLCCWGRAALLRSCGETAGGLSAFFSFPTAQWKFPPSVFWRGRYITHLLPLLSEADALSKAGGQLAFISQDPHASPAKPRGAPPGSLSLGSGSTQGTSTCGQQGCMKGCLCTHMRVCARTHTHLFHRG